MRRRRRVSVLGVWRYAGNFGDAVGKDDLVEIHVGLGILDRLLLVRLADDRVCLDQAVVNGEACAARAKAFDQLAILVRI